MTHWSKRQITSKLPQFRNWLAANGAQVLEPTNEWEITRFKAGDETGIIYTNAKGDVTFTGPASEAWQAFKGAHSWRAAPATKRREKSGPICRALRARDGGHCFFCLKPVTIKDESVEHLVPITSGGPDHIANKFLAHRVCNSDAGHLSAVEKIALHVEAHLKKLEHA